MCCFCLQKSFVCVSVWIISCKITITIVMTSPFTREFPGTSLGHVSQQGNFSAHLWVMFQNTGKYPGTTPLGHVSQHEESPPPGIPLGHVSQQWKSLPQHPFEFCYTTREVPNATQIGLEPTAVTGWEGQVIIASINYSAIIPTPICWTRKSTVYIKSQL